MSSESIKQDSPWRIYHIINLALSEAIELKAKTVRIVLRKDRVQIRNDDQERDSPPRMMFVPLFGCLWLYSLAAAKYNVVGKFSTISDSEGGDPGVMIEFFANPNRNLTEELSILTKHVSTLLDNLS